MTWATTKKQEKLIEINEMRILRSYSDTQRRDQERAHPRNNESDADCQNISRSDGWTGTGIYRGVGPMLRRDEEHIPRKVLITDIPGKRKIERPKTRWKTRANVT